MVHHSGGVKVEGSWGTHSSRVQSITVGGVIVEGS